MTPNSEIDHLLILYFTNRATDVQKRKLEDWVEASEANRAVFEHVRELWSLPANSRVDQKMRSTRDAIWAAGTSEAPIAKKERRKWQFWPGIVATLLVTFAICWATLTWITSPEEVIYVRKVNPTGQKSMHMLPDGTQVWLNSASSLVFPEKFSDTLRLVQLSGEAFFEVAKEKARPFIVATSGTTTEALGTAFNIQAYADDEVTKIALLNGKVRVQDINKTRKSMLSPGEELVISGDSFRIHKYSYEQTFGWKQGILIFEGIDFKTFCDRLHQWYGVRIEIKGAPRSDWNIRARYKNESLQYVLRDISFNKNFTFELEDKELIINFNKKPMKD